VAITVDIGGTLRPLVTGSLDIVETINGRASLRAGIRSTTGAYIPEVEDEVIVYEGATVIFRGIIADVAVRYLLMGASLISVIEAADYSAYAERRVIKASTGGGITGRDAIDYIVDNYLAVYGVTRDVGMPAGGTLGALSYDYAKVSDVLNDIVRMAAPTGWLWRIDDGKVLEAFLPGAVAWPCPFSITTGDSNVVGDIEVRTMRQQYANTIYLTYGDGTPTPAVVTATNTSEVTARGIYDAAIQMQGPLDVATAQAWADARLAQLSVAPRQVTFVTRELGAKAGQTITIDLAARGLDADFLITDVRAYDQSGVVFYRITATEGGTPADSWRETYKLWAGKAGAGAQPGGGGFGPTPSTVLFSEDFESGSTLATLGFVGYAGAVVTAANTTAQGLNGTTWGVLASGSYPEVGHDVPSPGYGVRRDGWVEVWTDFGDLQAFGWTFIAATDGNYSTSVVPIFDVYVGTDSGDPTFWVYTGYSPGTPIAQVSNVFTANTETLVRVEWRQSTYTGGVENSDGSIRILINGTQVLYATGVIIAAGGLSAPYEVTRIYTNPCGTVDEIRFRYGGV
jgi:hypothetical protein